MGSFRFVLSLSISALALSASASDFDVIHTRNHRVYSLPFYRSPVPTSVLDLGKTEMSFSYTDANDFRELVMSSGKFSIEDAETQRFVLDYRRGLGHGWDASIEVPYITRGGGYMDPLIDWWHAMFLKWSDSFRDKRPFGRSIVRFTDSRIFGPGSGIGDVSVTFQKQLPKSMSANVGFKAPTGDAKELVGSGGWDVGASVSKSWQLPKKITATAQLGAVYQGASDELQPARRWVHQEMLSFGYHANSRDVWVLQWQGEASALKLNISRSDQTQRTMTFGFRRKMSDRENLELFFTEDRDLLSGKVPEIVSIGPDFTFGLRWAKRF